MTTSESKGRFFLQNESIRIDSHNESIRIVNWNALASILYCDVHVVRNRTTSCLLLECFNLSSIYLSAVQKLFLVVIK